MANFFKEYQTQVKANKEAKESAERSEKRKEYTEGQVVYINPMYDENRNGKRYFATYLGDDSVLLAKTKTDALNGYGFIHSIHDIVK